MTLELGKVAGTRKHGTVAFAHYLVGSTNVCSALCACHASIHHVFICTLRLPIVIALFYRLRRSRAQPCQTLCWQHVTSSGSLALSQDDRDVNPLSKVSQRCLRRAFFVRRPSLQGTNSPHAAVPVARNLYVQIVSRGIPQSAMHVKQSQVFAALACQPPLMALPTVPAQRNS